VPRFKKIDTAPRRLSSGVRPVSAAFLHACLRGKSAVTATIALAINATDLFPTRNIAPYRFRGVFGWTNCAKYDEIAGTTSQLGM
jgi:hypothetical protein